MFSRSYCPGRRVHHGDRLGEDDGEGAGQAVGGRRPRTHREARPDGREEHDPGQRQVVEGEHDAERGGGDQQLHVDVEEPGRDRLAAGSALDEQHHAGAADEHVGRAERAPGEDVEAVAGQPDAGSRPDRQRDEHADDARQEQRHDVARPVRGEVVVTDAPPVEGERDDGLHHGGRADARGLEPAEAEEERGEDVGGEREHQGQRQDARCAGHAPATARPASATGRRPGRRHGSS